MPHDAALLLLSPHFDDAVLSAFALLRSSRDVEVVTVFTGRPAVATDTGWDRMCGFANSTDAARMRQEENDQALAGLDVGQHSLGLLDAQYLGGVRAQADEDHIVGFVGDWLDTHGPGCLVAAPAGAGRQVTTTSTGSGWLGAPRSGRRAMIRRAVGPVGRTVLQARAKVMASRTLPFAHSDHLTVRDAAVRAMAGRPQHGLLLYEDLPYLWGAPADDEAGDVARRLGTEVVEHHVRPDRVEKAARVAAYATQLRFMYAPLGPLNTPSGLPEVERYWSIGAAFPA